RIKLVDMLKEVRDNTYILTKYEWCSEIKSNLPKTKPFRELKRAFILMESALKKVSRVGLSGLTTDILEEKKAAIKAVIDQLEDWND
ncbi:hypothetical protein ACFL34_03025, partial [Candidatus Sumerlaeota bacterium]